jgi:hypothetical protein
MRKFLLFMLSLTALSFLGVEAASAYTLGTHYSVSDLQALCKRNHGHWAGPGAGMPGNYSCGKVCTAGGDWCTVGCNSFACYGDCPNCPARILTGGRKEIVGKILSGGAMSLRWKPWPGCDPNCACTSWIGCPCCIGPGPGGSGPWPWPWWGLSLR